MTLKAEHLGRQDEDFDRFRVRGETAAGQALDAVWVAEIDGREIWCETDEAGPGVDAESFCAGDVEAWEELLLAICDAAPKPS